ncbi:MAG: hypothetical protein MJE77_19590 [Proteobacteria bacterium]|nr:hypothetical protein [Pseudomonadota bacterium]
MTIKLTATLLACMLAVACAGSSDLPVKPAPLPEIIAFVNGQWFDGQTFVQGTRHVVDGVFREPGPGPVAFTIDLNGGYVVPPYGEGHNHFLEAEQIDIYIQHYLYRGVFYVKDQTTLPSVRKQIAPITAGSRPNYRGARPNYRGARPNYRGFSPQLPRDFAPITAGSRPNYRGLSPQLPRAGLLAVGPMCSR